ncbi:MAG: hypothetical protein WED34_02360 [Planctomycetales bacterium]
MNEHRIVIASPPDREKLVAMIDGNDEQWAEINQDSGELRLEIYPRRDGRPWEFALAGALTAIETAKARLVGPES